MATTQSYPGKSPDLIPLGDGLNFSTPLAQVAGTVVPNELFFLRSNNPPPTLEPNAWQMRLDGRVRKPLSVDLAALKRLPAVTEEAWLECAGNGRRRFDPPGEGNQWDDQAISNARFTGVSLSVLLDEAGVESDAVEIVATGADADSFQRGLPIDVARRPEVILAYAMNGEPLLPPNGGPVRLLVPRWAGIASVKWPIHLEVVNTPFSGYWNVDRYVMVDAAGETMRSVREMPVKSMIAWPAQDEHVPASPHVVFGFAWSGHAEIARVEVSEDGGGSWSEARLERGEGAFAWTRWEHAWNPATSGEWVLCVRATDKEGNTQPTAVEWNKFGYEMNAVMERRVVVRD